MRPGLFVALAVALFAVVLLVLPVPHTIEALPGGVSPASRSAAVCLTLSYDDTMETRYAPRTVRLTADTLMWNRAWFRAVGGPGERLYTQAMWRPAGPDSLDIAWHHSRIVRIPAQGARRVGRAAASFVGTIWDQLAVHDYGVIATPSRCAE